MHIISKHIGILAICLASVLTSALFMPSGFFFCVIQATLDSLSSIFLRDTGNVRCIFSILPIIQYNFQWHDDSANNQNSCPKPEFIWTFFSASSTFSKVIILHLLPIILLLIFFPKLCHQNIRTVSKCF